MAGYVVTARIEGGVVRGRAPGRDRAATLTTAGILEAAPIGASIELEAPIPPLLTELGDRFGYIAEAWAQTMFFLTDPKSWR